MLRQPIVSHEPAAEHRADDEGEAVAACPDAHGMRALGRSGKASASRTSDIGTMKAAPRPLTTRPAIRVAAFGASAQTSVPTMNRECRHEDAAASVKIAERAAGQQEARIDEIVGVDDPLHRADAGVKVGVDAFDREIDDGRVDLREQHAERCGDQDEARARLFSRRVR